MTVTIKWKGVKELQKAMLAMPKEIEKKIGDQAVRAGLSHYARVMRPKIPTDTKDNVHLKKSIKVRKAKKSKNRILAIVGILGGVEGEKDARRYAHVWEFGSSKQEGTRLFSTTFEKEIEPMLDIMADKIRAGLKKYGGS